MKNWASVIILVVALSTCSDAAPDHTLEAHYAPSHYKDGIKWELGRSSHEPLHIYKAAPSSHVPFGVHNPTHNQIDVHQPTYHHMPVQPVLKRVQQPAYRQHQVHQPYHDVGVHHAGCVQA